MLRRDEPSQTKLQQLVKQFGASRTTMIRQLIAHATLEVFPKSWHTRAAELLDASKEFLRLIPPHPQAVARYEASCRNSRRIRSVFKL